MPGAVARMHSVWRRPLWMAFVFGCLVSAMASGRFSVRLIADGLVSFAFVPAFEVAALAIVCRGGVRARLPFAEAVERFFAGNTPWLVWMTVVAAAFAVVPPRELGPLFKPALFASVVPLVWSGYADFRFFRDVMQRDVRGARRDVVLYRLIAWTSVLTYFFGIAAWHEYVRQTPFGFGLGTSAFFSPPSSSPESSPARSRIVRSRGRRSRSAATACSRRTSTITAPPGATAR